MATYLDPATISFDIVYRPGMNLIVEKTTKRVVAAAYSGGQALSFLLYYNSEKGKREAVSKFYEQDLDYEYNEMNPID